MGSAILWLVVLLNQQWLHIPIERMELILYYSGDNMITKLNISFLLQNCNDERPTSRPDNMSADKDIAGCLRQLAVSQTTAVERHGADTSLIDKAVMIILQ